ncbi:MAG: MFS transporter [Acholeplasmatales bacterium]
MKKKVLYLYIFTTLYAIVINLAHPVTPAFIRNLGITEYMFGLFFAAMNLGTFIMSPFWGNLGDVKKRKYIIMIGVLGYSISQMLFGMFTNAYYILIVRFTGGVFSSSVIVSLLAYIAEDRDITNKKSVIAWFLTLITFGGSISYLISGQLGDLFYENLSYVFYIQAIASFVVALLALFLDTEVHGSQEKKSLFKQIKQIKYIPKRVVFLFIIIAILNIPIVNFTKYIDLYITDLGYRTSVVGYFSFTTGIIAMITTIAIVPIITRKFPPIKTAIVSLLIGAAISFTTFIFKSEYLIICLYTFFMVYIAARSTYEPSIVNHLNEEKNLSSGMLMGLRQSSLSLGAVIGPIVSGFLYGYLEVGLFYFLSSILVLGAILLTIYYFWYKKGVADDFNRANN